MVTLKSPLPEKNDPRWLIGSIEYSLEKAYEDFELIKIALLCCDSDQPEEEILKQVRVLLDNLRANQECLLDNLAGDFKYLILNPANQP